MLKRTLKFLLPACLLIAAVTSLSANAAGRTFWLNVVNVDEMPIKVTIAQISCYEPELEGQHGTEFTLKPNATYGFWINRVQGNDCDGEQGEFKLTFAPGPNDEVNTLTRTETYFTFDNDMNLAVDHNHHPNQYPGNLIKTAGDKYQYQTSKQLMRPSFDKPTGDNKAYWDLVCSAPCTLLSSVTVTKGTSKEKVRSGEETDAISKSLTIGVEFPYGISAEASTSTENSKTQGYSFSSAMTEERSTTSENSMSYSSDDFSRFGIKRIWQWVAEVPMQSGKKVLIRSINYTCTPDGKRPTYLPDSNEAIGSCSTEVERQMSAKEALELKLAQLNLEEMQRKLGMASQPATQPSATIAGLSAVANNGPISILSPSNWSVDQSGGLFDVKLTAPSGDAATLFKFVGVEVLAETLQTIDAALSEDIGPMTPNGKSGQTQISGMSAEFAEYTASKSGKPLDVGVIVIQVTQTQAVLLFTIVASSKAQQYQSELGQILASLKAK